MILSDALISLVTVTEEFVVRPYN